MATQSNPYSSALAEPAGSRAPLAALLPAGARRRYFSSAVGTKVLIAVTGLLLVLYLILHLAGNLLIYLGPATFNGYSHFLLATPLVVPIEIGLAAIFIIHLYKAVTNGIANRRARPVPYYQPVRRYFGWGWAGRPSRKSFASTTMIVSGLVILLFVIVHLRQFKYGPEYVVAQALPAEPAIRDLYRLEIEVFGNPLNVAFYLLCMVVVGSHLWHGFSSAFNSLGADHPRYTPWVLAAGKVLAMVMAVGFLTIPLWAFFFGSRT